MTPQNFSVSDNVGDAGLTSGLSGVDMTSDNIKDLQNSIAKLLSGVESAFVTSLVGIFFGLVYSVAHHKLIVALHDKIAQLTDALDEKFPRRSAEDWLSKNFSEAQTQSAEFFRTGLVHKWIDFQPRSTDFPIPLLKSCRTRKKFSTPQLRP
ncbi:MAG: hypothetical protein SR1Q7_00080 [Quinella sp. 1Q7]|nr:hypothetical protein [Quinella sp. 1Q7]